MASQDVPRNKAVSLRELKSMRFKPEKRLLGKLILARSIGMMFGPRGSGKSMLAMIIAYAVAAQKAVYPWGDGSGALACYLDGEMRIRGFQERIDQLHAFNSDSDSGKLGADNFHVISRDLVGATIGSIDVEEGQKAIDALIPDGVRLIVIDNLAAWTEAGGEGASWQVIKKWLLQKRLNGVAVLLLHHAGKSGAQRGTSAHEDLLDYSIRVTPVAGEDPSTTVFDVDHTKLRDHLPELRGTFRFSIRTTETNVLQFTSAPVATKHDELSEKIKKHRADGLNNAQIAAKVGCHKTTVGRILKAMVLDEDRNAKADDGSDSDDGADDSQEDE